jgi:hypothetical protein
MAENHSSTALIGCSWTFDSALAGAAIVDTVAQHWLSWMLERSSHLVAEKPDWSWVSARGPSSRIDSTELSSELASMSRNRRNVRCGFLFGTPEADAPTWVCKIPTSPIEKLIPNQSVLA